MLFFSFSSESQSYDGSSWFPIWLCIASQDCLFLLLFCCFVVLLFCCFAVLSFVVVVVVVVVFSFGDFPEPVCWHTSES